MTGYKFNKRLKDHKRYIFCKKPSTVLLRLCSINEVKSIDYDNTRIIA